MTYFYELWANNPEAWTAHPFAEWYRSIMVAVVGAALLTVAGAVHLISYFRRKHK